MRNEKDHEQCSAVIADDPTASKEWNEGCDFAMEQLCRFLGVDPSSVSWDAATETVDGDIQAVIGNILCAKFGEDWGPNETLPEGVSVSAANKAIEFCAWLSGYIGHGPAVQINSDSMDYIRSKVHPLMVDLGVVRPSSTLNEPQEVKETAVERFQKRVVKMIGEGFRGFHFTAGDTWDSLTTEQRCGYILDMWDAPKSGDGLPVSTGRAPTDLRKLVDELSSQVSRPK